MPSSGVTAQLANRALTVHTCILKTSIVAGKSNSEPLTARCSRNRRPRVLLSSVYLHFQSVGCRIEYVLRNCEHISPRRIAWRSKLVRGLRVEIEKVQTSGICRHQNKTVAIYDDPFRKRRSENKSRSRLTAVISVSHQSYRCALERLRLSLGNTLQEFQ